MNCHIITVSDRASRGEYDDRSGPRVREYLEAHAREHGQKTVTAVEVVPDEPAELRAALMRACDIGADVIVTTGGTGIGPRDSTPEVVLEFAERSIPGIMEHIRTLHGQRNPRALLSRSVAAIRGTTAIYAIPGSVKAVDEYMPEILKTLDHVLALIQGKQVH